MRVLVTGGAGFIGSALTRRLAGRPGWAVCVLDKMTYAATPGALAACEGRQGYRFVRGDIADGALVGDLLEDFAPDVIVNLAAETHVDRSIDGPEAFIQSNIVGASRLLEAARRYHDRLEPERRARFRLHHVSTDEVFGALGDVGTFDERSPYAPRSPYAASKAAADHLVRAWGETFGLPVLVTNCSNNYGPFQFPEKLIPLTIVRALREQPIPVYGDGLQVRDWLHVEDHVEALERVFSAAAPGASYMIGGQGERTNMEVIRTICATLDELAPRRDGRPHAGLIEHVEDRPGHDRRYAVDASRISAELGWRASRDLQAGLRETVGWYLDHRAWWEDVLARGYGGQRLGLGRG